VLFVSYMLVISRLALAKAFEEFVEAADDQAAVGGYYYSFHCDRLIPAVTLLGMYEIIGY